MKNFRTLHDVTIRFNGYYTALSGQNNAGKTSVIRAVRHTFNDMMRARYFYPGRADEVVYSDDKTQWVTGTPDISFDYTVAVTRADDPGLFQFLEKITENAVNGESLILRLELRFASSGESTCRAWVGSIECTSFVAKEILQKLRSSTLAFTHDSANSEALVFGPGGRHLHELLFSADERRQVAKQMEQVQKKVKAISKAHKSELAELLGHLSDQYEVDFSVPEGMYAGAIPFAVNLKDRAVDIPLNDWGSGTKNRTQVMMSILHAHRTRSKLDENRITPFMIIEEPESFLHPAAQAEFGRVLIDLANELKIQTIVTTHSPYMLCQSNAAANVLLGRKVAYGKAKQTEVIAVEEGNWMRPFAEILGLDNAEFLAWKDVLRSSQQCVLLVEGEIDRAYFEHISSLGFAGLQLPNGLEIVPYEGKDALKNSILLKFVVQKFKRVLVTFDLDAKVELERVMTQIGLVEGQHFLPVGDSRPGRQCIEGLLPDRVLSKVHGSNPDLVMQLTAQDGKDRKSAKSAIKQKLLAEFKADTAVTADELLPFGPIFKALKRVVANGG